jgi:hypothetical protein
VIEHGVAVARRVAAIDGATIDVLQMEHEKRVCSMEHEKRVCSMNQDGVCCYICSMNGT